MPPNNRCPEIGLEAFSKVVESIYDCSLDPSRWPTTLNTVVELLRSKVCGFVIAGQHPEENLSFHVGVDDNYVRLYEETYAALNPHLGPLQLAPVGQVMTTPMMLDEREFLESRFYLEFLKPQALRDAIGFNVLRTPARVGALAATRLESRGAYGDNEIRLLSLLAPHVCRSVAISDALNLRTLKTEDLEATLDALSAGVFMTDREGRIIYMNRAGERLVRTGNALRAINKRLAAVDGKANSQLAQAIAEAAVDETEVPTGGISIAIPSTQDAGCVATVLPLSRGYRRNLGGTFAATVAVFVQDPVVSPTLPGDAFAKLYGLTGSELRVLLTMVPGLSIKEAAEILGISDTTAKTHLHHIYAKTGTSKQTELMHLFMNSAPPVQAR